MNEQEEKIYRGCICGFEYEFFSIKSRKDIAKELGAILKKKIVIGETYHINGIDPNQFLITPDFSMGVKGNELITPPLPYIEAISHMFKILSYIRDNGFTTEKCALHVNISFDKFILTDMKETLEGINRLKFILGFNEGFVYDRFPKRRSSIYARSINNIFPIHKFMMTNNNSIVNKENYELPNEKYFGVNFSKLAKKYLEIRYIGGRGYEKKPYNIKEIVDYVLTFTYNTLQDNYNYSTAELSRLSNAMKEYQKVVTSFSDINQFFFNYPNIRLMVDLKGEIETLKTFWVNIREKLFDLIVRCGMRRGMINYDADISKYQVKDVILQKAFPIKNMEIFDSKILSGNIVNCDIYRCDINNAHILDCNLYSGNKINDSKIIATPFHTYNEAIDCYIDNRRYIVNGKVERGIIRSGNIGPTAKISKETEVISKLIDGKDTKDFPGKQDGPSFQGGGKDKDMPKTQNGFKFILPKIEKEK